MALAFICIQWHQCSPITIVMLIPPSWRYRHHCVVEKKKVFRTNILTLCCKICKIKTCNVYFARAHCCFYLLSTLRWCFWEKKMYVFYRCGYIWKRHFCFPVWTIITKVFDTVVWPVQLTWWTCKSDVLNSVPFANFIKDLWQFVHIDSLQSSQNVYSSYLLAA